MDPHRANAKNTLLQSIFSLDVVKSLKEFLCINFVAKKTAKIIISKHHGKIPDNYEDLMSLPGIGNYTANAILAIAFNKSYIPLDGNIERVLKRYLYLKKNNKIKKNNLIKKKSIFEIS